MKTEFENRYSELIAQKIQESSFYKPYTSLSGRGEAHTKKESRFIHKSSKCPISINGKSPRIIAHKEFWFLFPQVAEFLGLAGQDNGSTNIPNELRNKQNSQNLNIKNHDELKVVEAALLYKLQSKHINSTTKTNVDDETSQAGFDNGTVEENDVRRWHLRKERSSKFRQFAIEMHGTICQACDVDYSHVYGDLWNGFVEAHHLFPRSEIKELKKTDVRKEACVLCANCHRMIHRWMSSEGVKGRLDYNRNDLLSFRKEIIKSDAK